jgi:hypothetical protein
MVARPGQESTRWSKGDGGRRGAAARLLTAAVDLYRQVLTALGRADASEVAMKSAEGREKLARLAESTAAIERAAIAELERALASSSPSSAGRR